MKPKPLLALNHFTVPTAMSPSSLLHARMILQETRKATSNSARRRGSAGTAENRTTSWLGREHPGLHYRRFVARGQLIAARSRLSPDARRVLWAQALRALVYGFGSVLLGPTLERRGFSSTEVGGVLTAVVAGTVVTSLAVGRWGDRVGRRRAYVSLYLALAAAG